MRMSTADTVVVVFMSFSLGLRRPFRFSGSSSTLAITYLPGPGASRVPSSPQPRRGRHVRRGEDPTGNLDSRDVMAGCRLRLRGLPPLVAQQLAAFAEAEIPVVVADDEVIEQLEISRSAAAPSRTVVARRRHSASGCRLGGCGQARGPRARRQDRGHEHVRHRDLRAGARAARQQVPGEQPVARREAGHTEQLDRMVGDEGPVQSRPSAAR